MATALSARLAPGVLGAELFVLDSSMTNELDLVARFFSLPPGMRKK